MKIKDRSFVNRIGLKKHYKMMSLSTTISVGTVIFIYSLTQFSLTETAGSKLVRFKERQKTDFIKTKSLILEAMQRFKVGTSH